MSFRRGPLLFLVFTAGAVAAAVACGNDPPPETPVVTPRPPDKTEVTMSVAIPEAGAPEPTSSSPTTTGQPIDPSDDPNIGGPQEAAVEESVAPIRPRLRACYKKALAAQPGLAGSATFDTTIGKDGKVASARFVKKEGLNDDMVNCLTSTVKAMSFKPDRKSQVVAFTFGTPAPAGASTAPASIASGRAPAPSAAPAASYGGSDAGPLRH